jgi:hypothetical protein
MNSKVKVVADATTGAVINLSPNNENYGYIRVEQSRTVIDDNGFLRRKVVSTLVPGVLSELQEEGFYKGQELAGKIIIKESLTPFNEKQPEKDLKIAGDTGIVCKFEGSPIYRKTQYTLASNAEDVLIKHDNVDELRTAYAIQNNKSQAIKPNTDFAI